MRLFLENSNQTVLHKKVRKVKLRFIYIRYGNGNMSNYYIADNSLGYTTAPWKEQRKLIKYVIIEYDVTNIGSAAFYYYVYQGNDNYYPNIINVRIGNSVKIIGYEAFYQCKSLTTISNGNSVTSIENNAFHSCISLTTITIGNSVTSIGKYAFEYCSSLTTIVIGNSVTSIGEYAFDSCLSLTNFYFYGTKEPSYGNYVFNECSSLTTIYVPTTYTDDDETKFCGFSFTIKKELIPK